MFDDALRNSPKVKASQCFTKYRWRSREAAGDEPVIVSTQVCIGLEAPQTDTNARISVHGISAICSSLTWERLKSEEAA